MVQSSISYWQQNDSNNVNNINYLPEHIKIALVDWWGARTVVLHLQKKKTFVNKLYKYLYIWRPHYAFLLALQSFCNSLQTCIGSVYTTFEDTNMTLQIKWRIEASLFWSKIKLFKQKAISLENKNTYKLIDFYHLTLTKGFNQSTIPDPRRR